ncbi:MAG: hypothetical protein LBH44_05780 [Treponema sp.]|jgi:hypothetical protein|nr:hypothetical protein [Treponema sp.]
MKTTLKLLFCSIVYTIVFVAANVAMPFSPEFKELGASGGLTGLVFMLLNAVWICFAIYFIIRHTHYRGIKLFINLLFAMFFVAMFMTQIETLLFGAAFPVLTKPDIMLIMAAGLFPLLATIPLLMKFFQNKDNVIEKEKIDIKNIAIKLGIIGIVYCCVYMLFGYFVAWQFEELRIFYTGSPEKLSFWGKIVDNIKTNPEIFPFQILRGILFGIFVLPLQFMLNKSKTVFITGVSLVYLCTAVVLIIPNPLFPDAVRFGHLIEMTSSMLVFGIITGNILWWKKIASVV